MVEQFPLRGYQVDCINSIWTAWSEGITRQGIVIPTGGGKTVIFCRMLSEIGERAVIQVHRDELVKQTVEKLNMIIPSARVAVCKAERGRLISEMDSADIIVASTQTLARENRLDVLRMAIGPGRVLVSDEMHHDMADSRRRTIERLEPGLLLGFTATPKRSDARGLGSIYQRIIYQVSLAELVAIGMLARPIGIRIGTGVNLNGAKSAKKEDGETDWKDDELEAYVNSPERNALAIKAWEEHARGKRKRTIVFCVNVKHVEDFRLAATEAGIKAEAIIGATPEEEREAIYERFRDGTTEMLISCMVLTEGWDEPRADCALMLRPTQSRSLYQQMAGRILRKWPGKPDALILDMVDITAMPLQSIASLSDYDPEDKEKPEPKEGELFDPIREAEERKVRIRHGAEHLGSLLESNAYAWGVTNNGLYCLPIDDDLYLSLAEVKPNLFYPIEIHAPRGGTPIARPLFTRLLGAEMAMEVASQAIPRKSKFAEKRAFWRTQEPTESQRLALQKVGVELEEGATRGEAANLLTLTYFKGVYKRAKITEMLTEKGLITE